MVETLSEAVKHRGSSLADEQYRDLYGAIGDYQGQHQVYDREGQACRRCRNSVVQGEGERPLGVPLRALPDLSRPRRSDDRQRPSDLAVTALDGPGRTLARVSPFRRGRRVGWRPVFLKSLTLKGFKSFADPSTLLLEPGVTVVVGPNGSGKSNVVDAVAWVLGAQGPRTVRSSKMEDVIFAGSADRPRSGRAEVSLTIDNRTGRAPGRAGRDHHHPHAVPIG